MKREETEEMSMCVYKSGGTHITSRNCRLAGTTTLPFSFLGLVWLLVYI